MAQPKVIHYVLERYLDSKVEGMLEGYVVSKELTVDLLNFYTYKKSKKYHLIN